eukprot:m.200328 g.200328  ORF g.200328 m.200328 type:complete len:668 (+) comp14958_c0_seq6:177-2180(+)
MSVSGRESRNDSRPSSAASGMSRVCVTPRHASTGDEVQGKRSLSRKSSGSSVAPLVDFEAEASWTSTISKKALSKLSARERKRQQVMHEIITTEQSYFRNLIVIKKLFRKSIEDEGLLDSEGMYRLFSNLDELIEVNGELLQKLKQKRKDGLVSEIGSVFVELLKRNRFDVYITFCANQNPACELYLELKSINPRFAQVMSNCEARIEESGGFDLPAFLLKGMQRLLKYTPLLLQVQKYSKDSELQQIRVLNEALALLETVATRVNEEVRRSDNARRLPIIAQQLHVDSTLPWRGRQTPLNLRLDAEDVSQRPTLLHEGPLRLIRLQEQKRAVDVHAILLSNAFLITVARDDKLIVRFTKEYPPLIRIKSIIDVRAEAPLKSRERTILMLEFAEKQREVSATPLPLSLGRVSPRHTSSLSTVRHILRFEAPSQAVLKTWMGHLLKARQAVRNSELQRIAAATPHSAGDEQAVALVVSSTFGTESETDVDSLSDSVADWEISFCDDDDAVGRSRSRGGSGGDEAHMRSGTAKVETTRHVRLVPGADGLGITLIGKQPVRIQEVDPGSSAEKAGLHAGDAIRAVNGTECTNMTHDEVISLIKTGLNSERIWHPVGSALQPIVEHAKELALAAATRGCVLNLLFSFFRCLLVFCLSSRILRTASRHFSTF